ncbi:MAG: helix-turn-helix domain-containing protein [Nanoarchaeota archaeon]|nr:helix-turn-helix domain-containing protein [Nanoarchaeota archaeon]
MFEAKFKLKHKGCWTEGLKKFKSSFTTHNTVSLNPDLVQDVTEVLLSSKKEAVKIKKYLKNHPLIKKSEILEEDDKKMLIQIFTDTSKISSIVHEIIQSKCFVSKKVPLVDGWEIWTIAAPKKTAIKNALEEIKKHGEFKLLYIKKSTFDGFNLSEKQEKILRMALEKGYYNWPKKTSIQQLAKSMKLSKPTTAEHLRKAEIKIINREFGKS